MIRGGGLWSFSLCNFLFIFAPNQKQTSFPLRQRNTQIFSTSCYPIFLPVLWIKVLYLQFAEQTTVLSLLAEQSVSSPPPKKRHSPVPRIIWLAPNRCHKWTILVHLLAFLLSFLWVVQAKRDICFCMQTTSGARAALAKARQRKGVQLWRHPSPNARYVNVQRARRMKAGHLPTPRDLAFYK